jgi:hypothetical protein
LPVGDPSLNFRLIEDQSQERRLAGDHERTHVLENVHVIRLKSCFALDTVENPVDQVLDLGWRERGTSWATQNENCLDRLCPGCSLLKLAE